MKELYSSPYGLVLAYKVCSEFSILIYGNNLCSSVEIICVYILREAYISVMFRRKNNFQPRTFYAITLFVFQFKPIKPFSDLLSDLVFIKKILGAYVVLKMIFTAFYMSVIYTVSKQGYSVIVSADYAFTGAVRYTLVQFSAFL